MSDTLDPNPASVSAAANGKIPAPAMAKPPPGRERSAAGGVGSGGGDPADGGAPDGDGAPAAREPREAIIYFPGLRRDPGVESIEAVAHRVALAMDNNDPHATYCAATGETAVFGADRARKATVVRKKSGGTEAGVLDLYEFDYRGPLVDSFGKRSALYQAWQVFATMAAKTRNFVAAVKRPGQSIAQKLQVLYGGMLLGTMLVYVAFVLLTAALTAKQGVLKLAFGSDSVRVEKVATTTPAVTTPAAGSRPRGTATAKPRVAPPTEGQKAVARANTAVGSFFSPFTRGVRWFGEVVWALLVPIGLAIGAGVRAVGGWLAQAWKTAEAHRDVLQAAVVSITVLGLGFRFNLKDALARTAGTTACVGSYLAYGRGRPEIVGMMARLLEHLRANPGVEYTRLHVVGYSFGSVVAIDCIYQRPRDVRAPRVEERFGVDVVHPGGQRLQGAPLLLGGRHQQRKDVLGAAGDPRLRPRGGPAPRPGPHEHRRGAPTRAPDPRGHHARDARRGTCCRRGLIPSADVPRKRVLRLKPRALAGLPALSRPFSRSRRRAQRSAGAEEISLQRLRVRPPGLAIRTTRGASGFSPPSNVTSEVASVSATSLLSGVPRGAA